MNNKKTYELVLLSMFIAIEVVLYLTPLGYVRTGFISGTTMHIPVILAAIFLGYKGGIITGLLMGCLSILSSTMHPGVTSFLFSPFYSLGEIHGNFWSVFNAIAPRIMIGVVSAFLYQTITFKKPNKFAFALTGVAGSLTNTILVCINIFVFFKDSFAAVRNVSTSQVIGLLTTLFATNGVSEAILAAILCAALGPVLTKIKK